MDERREGPPEQQRRGSAGQPEQEPPPESGAPTEPEWTPESESPPKPESPPSEAPPAWPAPPEQPQPGPPFYGPPGYGQQPGRGGPPPAWPAPPEQPPGYGGPPAYGAPPPGYGAPPPPGPGSVHPLDVGRAFSVAWSLFRFRWQALIGTLLIVLAPAYALNALWLLVYGDALERWAFEVPPRPGAPPPTFADLPPLPLEALGLLIVVSLVSAVVALISTAAVVNILGWTYGGGWTTVGRALGSALRRALSLIGAGLLIFLAAVAILIAGSAVAVLLVAATASQPGPAVLLGLIAIVATFAALIFVLLRWLFTVHAIVLEGHGTVDALGRSWRLVSGSTWRVLGYMLLLILVFLLVGLVVGVVQVLAFGLGMDPLTGQPVPFDPVRAIGQLVIQAAFSLVVTPFYLAFLTLLYYDLRWRAGEQLAAPPD